jgi:hypothetical protein
MKANDRNRRCERDWRCSLLTLTEKPNTEVHWLALLSEVDLGRRLCTIDQASGIPDAPAFLPESCAAEAPPLPSKERLLMGIA